MGTSISTRIMTFNGQCVNQIYHDEEQQCTIIKCGRDKRINAIDPITGCKETYPFMGVLSIFYQGYFKSS